MISVVLPSYLDEFQRSATNRANKLIRAIESVKSQTYDNWNLIIISDGCQKTIDIYNEFYIDHEKIFCISIPKQKMFSGFVRQTGVDVAKEFKSDITCYLDSDDVFGNEHLQNIINQFQGNWVYWNDLHWNRKQKVWYERDSRLIWGDIGTSCIAHQSDIPVKWTETHFYQEDQHFIQSLKITYPNPAKIKNCQYYLMHCPDLYDL